jgi:putative transposase
VSAVAKALRVFRHYLASARGKAGLRCCGRAALPEQVGRIEALIIDLPTYGYCRIHALL